MKLLGRLYLTNAARIAIHSREDGKIYYVTPKGKWLPSMRSHIPRSWRLIGDSYAKD